MHQPTTPVAGPHPDARHQSGRRRYPIGAEVGPDGVHFRVWAPKAKAVTVEFTENRDLPTPPPQPVDLHAEADGYFSGFAAGATAGMLYRLRLGEEACPDPASRFQPQGPHGPSQIIDPFSFRWSDAGWRGCEREGQVIYEMHLGTFTPEGTWAAAQNQLPALVELGITLVEVMPIADFPGRFGWGYDGVSMFAPCRAYGTPDDFRAFVDRAHGLGLGVILDVVYNHLGPDGNYLRAFSDDYFAPHYWTEWGDALNFDAQHCEPVREFFITNAACWIEEFHLDGLRLDATQQIYDISQDHILAVITRRARQAARGRSLFIVAENEPQEVRLIRPPEHGGFGIDALWNDDFHHAAMVAATGRSEAYYSDYRGSPQEFISALKWGFLYQGQRYSWQEQGRGTVSLREHPTRFITFLQNHDQVANTLRGQRLHQVTTPGRWRALTALLLLGPNTPMLFQGQEFAASAPFLFFADHPPALARLVAAGRREFLAQFSSLASRETDSYLAPPGDQTTFERCKLDLAERQTHRDAYQLHGDLLKLRRSDPVFSRPRPGGVDGAVLAGEAFVLRFFGQADNDRLLLMNLGCDLRLDPAPEPLLAPLEGCVWRTLWSSEDPRYGGGGTYPLESADHWRLPGHAAVVLAAEPVRHEPGDTDPKD